MKVCDRNGYPWPASALGSQEMEILCKMRQETGKPITKCLKEALLKMGKLQRGRERRNRVSSLA